MMSEQSVGGDLVESEFDPQEVDDQLHVDPVHSWKILGHGVADWVSGKLPEYFSHVLMFPGKATADSNYLRAALGNIWLIFPAVGVVLGVMAALDVAEMPIPPATWIFCSIMALGILDAFAGMMAFLVFFVMVAITGDFSTLHAITGMVGLAILWFGAAQLAHAFRPIDLWDEEPTLTLRIWRIGGDLIILPIIGAFLLSRLVRVLPFFTGLKVPIVEQKNLI
ncbi:MAG: hypothetical protein WCI12_09210, partial [Actinomycetes bacterium]